MTASKLTNEAFLKQLKDPFDPRFVKWRVGQVAKDKTKGKAFAYLDAREVYKRLDDVCGFDGWSSKLIEIKDGFICELSIKMPNGEWVTKSDSADLTDMEAIKGGASSALKRAAAVWGVGRYLYYLPTVWAPVKVLYTKKNGEAAYGLDGVPELPEWAKPNPNIERWEDIAEMQDTLNEPDIAEDFISNLDMVRGAKDSAELEAFVTNLSNDEQILLANEINIKRRELSHDSKISTNS